MSSHFLLAIDHLLLEKCQSECPSPNHIQNHNIASMNFGNPTKGQSNTLTFDPRITPEVGNGRSDMANSGPQIVIPSNTLARFR